MAITALTLTTALASAEAVYNSKEKKLYLNRHFQPDENFENRATIEQLMAQVEKLPPKEGAAEKKRLVVFLNLLYPTSKKQDGKEKEKPEKPETLEDFKKAVAARCKATSVNVTPASQPTLSLAEQAKKVQKELSLFLFAYDLLEFERDYTNQRAEADQRLESLQGLAKDANLDVPEIFAMHVLCKFEVKKKPTGEVFFSGDVSCLSDKAYAKVLSLLDHPNSIVRNFANSIYLGKKYFDEFAATGIFKRVENNNNYILRIIHNNPNNNAMMSRVCPEFTEFLETIKSAALKEAMMGLHNYIPTQMQKFFHQFNNEKFLQSYRTLYDEFTKLQEKLHSSHKEGLAKKHASRLADFFLPGTPRKDEFPTPDELSKRWLEPKKPKEKSPIQVEEQPKKKPAKKTKTKASKDSKPQEMPTVQGKVTVKTKPVADTSFVRKILQTRKFPEIVYDKRVKEWQVARSDFPSGYTPDDAIWKHAFTTLVDPFVGTDYSFKDVWTNPTTGHDDPCYCILADVTFPSGITVPGVFQYTFDENGVCYHRWFGKMSNIERLDKAITEKRFKINFPPLVKAKSPSVEEINKIIFEIDPYFGSTTFNDKENGLKIKIYKVEE